MAKNTILGIDIGSDLLKMTLANGDQISKSVILQMPENMVKNGRVVSVEAMGELIRSIVKDEGLHCRNAALVLSGEQVYVQNVTMPRMTADQLLYNIPYEFRDYITDELKDYTFDYAMLSTPSEMSRQSQTDSSDLSDSEDGNTMELMAVAVKTEYIEEMQLMVRKAGMRLQVLSPKVSCYAALIRDHISNIEDGTEYGILDLGYRSIIMYIYRGDRHVVTRVLEIGMDRLDEVIADEMNVDTHLAHTYLLSNHENCQGKPESVEFYNRVAVELMRILNFYRFSNPDSNLNDLWLAGGGSQVPDMIKILRETLNVSLHSISELMPAWNQDAGQAELAALSYGVTKNL